MPWRGEPPSGHPEHAGTSVAALYPSLLGRQQWNRLAASVRRAHCDGASPVDLQGELRLVRGQGLLARLAVGLLCISPAGEGLMTTLAIRPTEYVGEIWDRNIAGWRLVSKQTAHRGLLRERFGPIVFDVRLNVMNDGALVYEQTACRVMIGRLGVRLPCWLAPHVEAAESPAAPDADTHLSVIVSSPLTGLPFVAWHGAWVLALAAVMIAEIILTLWDFIVEIAVRRSLGDVYAGERVTHAIMGVLYGAMVANLVPVMIDWWSEPTAFVYAPPDGSALLRWSLVVMGLGVTISGIRDLYASYGLPYGHWPWRADAATEAASP